VENKGAANMYTIKVIDFLNREKYLLFKSYSSALNAISSFSATKESEYSPIDYIEAAFITDQKTDQSQLINNDPIKIEFIL
jgi:hypothetical protein